MVSLKKKKQSRVSDMAQWINTHASKPNNLSLIPRPTW